MRIKGISIRNYKGIAHAYLDDLDKEPVITVSVSGRNGTGKSLLLEAVVGVWTVPGRTSAHPAVAYP
jgi:AAA15 family ATPase/GTPase